MFVKCPLVDLAYSIMAKQPDVADC